MSTCHRCDGPMHAGDCHRCHSWQWGRGQRAADWARSFQSFACHVCGAPVWLRGAASNREPPEVRTRHYGQGVHLEIPASFPVPTCTACDETFASIDWTLPLDDWMLRVYALTQLPRLVELELGCPRCGGRCELGGEPAPTYTCACGFHTHKLVDLKRVGLRGPDAHGFPRQPKKKPQPGRRTLRLRGAP